MPGLNGIDATRAILDESEHINILVMTMHDDDDGGFAAIRAGARGYQLKGAVQNETLRAIRCGRPKAKNLRAEDRAGPSTSSLRPGLKSRASRPRS